MKKLHEKVLIKSKICNLFIVRGNDSTTVNPHLPFNYQTQHILSPIKLWQKHHTTRKMEPEYCKGAKIQKSTARAAPTRQTTTKSIFIKILAFNGLGILHANRYFLLTIKENIFLSYFYFLPLKFHFE